MQINSDSESKIVKYLSGLWPFFWLFIVVIALYFKSLFFQYTFFDDHVLVLNRLDFFQHISNFWKIFSQEAFNNTSSKFYYRPILTATFFVDGWIGGGKLIVYHISNILYHLVACWLVFILLKKIIRSKITSFLLTAVFSVHPVITQVVVWIPGRNESLLTVFLILSFLSLLKYLEKNRIVFCLISLLFFSVALLIKELTVFFPFLIILYVFIFQKEDKKKLILMSVIWIILIVLWAIIRNKVLGKALGATNLPEMMLSVLNNILAIPAYIGKIFVPFGLSVYPDLKDLKIPAIIGCFIILLMGCSYFYKPADKKLMLFGLLWFLLFLIPGLIKAVNISEHRVYFSLIGILIYIAGLVGEMKIKWIPAFIFICFVMLSINISYSRNFKDRLTLWQQAVKSSPSSAFNANNLGAMYYLDKDFINAEKYFRKAIQINPLEPLANGNLGLVMMNSNRLNEAEIYLLNENKVNPAYDNAYFNLGILYLRKGDITSGTEYMVKTISINPGYIDAYKYLINIYQSTNQQLLIQQVYVMALRNGIKLN